MPNARNFKEIRSQHNVTESDYNLLHSDMQKVRERAGVWTTDHVLEQYVNETDQLIGILDNSVSAERAIDIRDPEIGEDEPLNVDSVIWLDKSARPVSWFVDALWDQIAKEGAEKPDYEFLNIDRVNWFVHTGYDESEAESRLGPDDFDVEKVDQARIDGLRALFVEGDLTEDNWREEVWNLPTRLDGQSVLIVDEVMNRGGTLAIAAQILKKAIPEAKFSGTYFWHTGRYSIDGISSEFDDMQMESAPVWYNKQSAFGRGVGDVSLGYWQHEYETNPTSDNLKKKVGAFALSAPHHNPKTYEVRDKDTTADKLKQDIAYLSYAVANGDVIRAPSRGRDDDDIIDTYAKQGLTLEEMKNFNRGRDTEIRFR